MKINIADKELDQMEQKIIIADWELDQISLKFTKVIFQGQIINLYYLQS